MFLAIKLKASVVELGCPDGDKFNRHMLMLFTSPLFLLGWG